MRELLEVETFALHEYDEATGLYYAQQRYYDPETASFISEDPAKDGINYYGYCGGNPVNMVDPFGLDADNGTAREGKSKSNSGKRGFPGYENDPRWDSSGRQVGGVGNSETHPGYQYGVWSSSNSEDDIISKKYKEFGNGSKILESFTARIKAPSKSEDDANREKAEADNAQAQTATPSTPKSPNDDGGGNKSNPFSGFNDGKGNGRKDGNGFVNPDDPNLVWYRHSSERLGRWVDKEEYYRNKDLSGLLDLEFAITLPGLIRGIGGILGKAGLKTPKFFLKLFKKKTIGSPFKINGDKIQYCVDPNTLKPVKNLKNLKNAPDFQIRLKNAQEFGGPIEVDSYGNILDGHHRLYNALQNNLPIDVIIKQ